MELNIFTIVRKIFKKPYIPTYYFIDINCSLEATITSENTRNIIPTRKNILNHNKL